MIHVIGACKGTIVRTLKEDQPLRLLLNLLFYYFNCSEPTYKSQRIGAFHATHYKQRFFHVSLEIQCTVRYQLYNSQRLIFSQCTYYASTQFYAHFFRIETQLSLLK